MILLSHPTGNANIRNAALATLEHRLLGEFWTSVCWRTDCVAGRFLPRAIRMQLERRAFPEVPRALVRTRPFRELGRFVAPRLGFGYFAVRKEAFFGIDSVYQYFDREVAERIRYAEGLSAVYTGEDCALETFRAASSRGWKRFYDLPIGYWRAGHMIYQEEAEREPAWKDTLGGIADSEQKLMRKDSELELADTVVVASSFTRRTLEKAPKVPADVRVIPYGAPAVPERFVPREAGKKLKVLFAGALGQRKGLSYLLQAMRQVADKAELTMLGRKTVEGCETLDEAVRIHRWIPSLPHKEVLQEMARHDVLVFPSLFEGFGLVILEAMSRGLPVITTEHTGGPDVIRDGVDGYIVPIRSADAITAKLTLLHEDRGLLMEMKHAAVNAARKISWEGYRRRLGEMLLAKF